MASHFKAVLPPAASASTRVFTAAHRTLRFGTCVRVVNVENGRAVKVRVKDGALS